LTSIKDIDQCTIGYTERQEGFYRTKVSIKRKKALYLEQSRQRMPMTTQISLSLELVYLINWMLTHQRAQLSAIVQQAVKQGLVEELSTLEEVEHTQSADFLYATLTNFLDFLEKNLIKQLETINVGSDVKDAIVPTLRKVDANNLDFKTVWESMQHTKARLKAPTTSPRRTRAVPPVTQNATEILFEELLKNWKPNNKETVN
jgi:hypothetical protein